MHQNKYGQNCGVLCDPTSEISVLYRYFSIFMFGNTHNKQLNMTNEPMYWEFHIMHNDTLLFIYNNHVKLGVNGDPTEWY